MGALTPAEIEQMRRVNARQRALADHARLSARGIVEELRKFDPGQLRDPHTGEWTDNPGQAVKDVVDAVGDLADEGYDPTAFDPKLLAATRGGPYHVALFHDPAGDYTDDGRPGNLVAVNSDPGGKAPWDDAQIFDNTVNVAVPDVPAVADGIDHLVSKAKGFKPTDAQLKRSEEWGPILIAEGEFAGHKAAIYLDSQGDLFSEGHMFVSFQSTKPRGGGEDWRRTVLDAPLDVAHIDARRAPALVRAMREMAAATQSAARSRAHGYQRIGGRLRGIVVAVDDDPVGELDEDCLALLTALDELCGQERAKAFNAAAHPRNQDERMRVVKAAQRASSFTALPNDIRQLVMTWESKLNLASATRQALLDHDALRIRGVLTAERKYNPGQLRDPHSGEWTDGPGSDAAADFAERIAKALVGADALESAPVRLDPAPEGHSGNFEGASFLSAPDGHGDIRALAEMEGTEYQATNSHLWTVSRPGYDPARDGNGKPLSADRLQTRKEIDAEISHRVAEVDRSMAVSPLPHDVVVHRGITNGIDAFGFDLWTGATPRVPGEPIDFDREGAEYERFQNGYRPDLTGLEWVQQSYLHTTVGQDFVDRYARKHLEQYPVAMRILLPAGTPAIRMSDMDKEAELMAARGLRLRVVKDHGEDANGVRHFDVEVVGDGTA